MARGSQPVFYLLYWQPLICNIAKVLNRHRYLDPRSPGTRLRHLVSQLPLITDQLPTFSARSCVKYFSSLAHLSKFFANEIRLLFPTPSSTRSKVQSEKVELASASQKVQKVGINSPIFRFEIMWGSQGNKILR